jgi:hypothetical protein
MGITAYFVAFCTAIDCRRARATARRSGRVLSPSCPRTLPSPILPKPAQIPKINQPCFGTLEFFGVVPKKVPRSWLRLSGPVLNA